MQVSKNKFQLSQSFSYKIDKKRKGISFAKGVLNLIPVAGFYRNRQNFKATRKLHKTWSDEKGFYFYDVRHSKAQSAVYLANMLGLGILIIPLRLLATAIKKLDKRFGTEYKNPHLLSKMELDLAIHLNKNSKTHYEEQCELYPGEEKYLKRKFFRDHIQNPCLFRKNVYADPIFISGDEEAKQRIADIMFRNKKPIEPIEEKIMRRVKELKEMN